MHNKLSTILALALMIGIISGLGFASILLRAESREAPDSNGGGGDSEDKGSKSNDDNSGDDKKSDSQEQETKDEPKEEDKSDSSDNKDSKVDEEEKAAQEDYINEEPGEKQPYPPVFDEETGKRSPPIKDEPKYEKCKEQSGGPDNTDYCDKSGAVNDKPVPPNKEIKKVWCNEYGWKWSCPSKGGHPTGCENAHANECMKGHPPHHPIHHKHPHSDNWCKWHDCHHHTHHHSNTHTSGHSGDVTVITKLKYEENSKKNLDDMVYIIGDIYDKELDLSDKPSEIKTTHLDIDGGDDFAVCLANEDSQNGDCTFVKADSDHDEVIAHLTVR